jgi:hypothetical protein
MVDGAPKPKDSRLIEASGVPLCTSVLRDRTMEMKLQYQMLE